jgi:hypothetical protein
MGPAPSADPMKCASPAISAGLGTSAVFGAAKDFAPAPGYRTRAWRHTGTRSG